MASTYNAPLIPSAAPAYSTVLCSTPEQMQRAMAIRHKVFCEEQGYDPAIEVDELSVAFVEALLRMLSVEGGEGLTVGDPTGSTRCVTICS
ncbi:Glucosamine 6-phosphate N-acetyltransferase [Rhodotorula toruloides]|nr:Glucosamine 6-phosphate N-acetyltransferase [Rhodotorula toruloides]